MVKDEVGKSIDAIYNEFDQDTQAFLDQLLEQLLAEQKGGATKPRTSIFKNLVVMDSGVIQDCIEKYAIMMAEEAARAEAGDAQKLLGKTDTEQEVACASVSSVSVVAPGAQVEANRANEETSAAADVNATASEAARKCDDWRVWGGWHSCRDSWSSVGTPRSWGAATHAWRYCDKGSWCKLYVANLPGGISRDDLEKLIKMISPPDLTPHEICVMERRQWTTGNSCALVIFSEPDNAELWRAAMVGKVLKASWLQDEFGQFVQPRAGVLLVKYAEHQQPPGQGGKGNWSSNGKGKGRGKGKSKAYVPVTKMQ